MSRGDVSVQVSKFLGRLEGVRSNGAGWSARCPCRNDDQNPSLSVGQGNDGRVLVTCHRGAGCSVDEICDAMGLKVAELMPEPELKSEKSKLTLVETYDYRDGDGVLLFQKQRFVDSATGKKTFRQRKPDGSGGWIFSLGDTPKVLYNLPAVLTAIANDDPVWVVEGEKDANTLIELGYVATTMPGGAGKWLQIHTDALAGGRIGVVSDNDQVGREHAATVLAALEAAGCRTKGFQPPTRFKDVSDLLGAGGSISDLEPLEAPQTASTEVSVPEYPTDEFGAVVDALAGLAAKQNLTLEQKIVRAHSLLDSAMFGSAPEELHTQNWYDFVYEDANDDYDWVIPGLLERTDRVIFVAAEGAGKTMMARQVAILTAYGLHPFTRARIPRIRTLTVDLENPSRIIRRKSKTIIDAAHIYSREKQKPEAHLVIKPSGMNLLKSDDRNRFEQAVEKHQPDILFIGPLYKAFIDPGGRNSESVATEIIMFLDYIRDTYRCALWMEQHAPLGSAGGRDLRPFGSAVWSRWPEFGLSMERDLTAGSPNTFKIGSFRGDRDERHWPTLVRWGETFPFDAIEYRKTS